MAVSDGYVRGETLDIFSERMDEDILNEIFEEIFDFKHIFYSSFTVRFL